MLVLRFLLLITLNFYTIIYEIIVFQIIQVKKKTYKLQHRTDYIGLL
jgi:hypothetical protein